MATSREVVGGGGVHGGGSDGTHEMRLRDFIRLQRQDDHYAALHPDDRLHLYDRDRYVGALVHDAL